MSHEKAQVSEIRNADSGEQEVLKPCGEGGMKSSCRVGNKWKVIHMRGKGSGADDAGSHDSEYKNK